MTNDNLWAIFRSLLDDIDTGVKTVSDVRKEMMKLQNEERDELDSTAIEPADFKLVSSSSDLS